MAENRRKGTSSFGFVSGGTLNLSSVDSSMGGNHETLDNKGNDNYSDMELNSDEDFISNIINYDDYIVVDEDEYEGNNKYMEKMSTQTSFRNKSGNRYNKYESKEREDAQMGLNEDNIQKIYGKGLNMLKKMGYKGGGLGRDGKGLVNPLVFTTNKSNDNITYKIEKKETHEATVSSERVEKDINWLTQLESSYNELVNKSEMMKKNKKDLESNNVKLVTELRLLNEQIKNKLKQLENIKLIKPTIIYNYKEYLKLLKDTDLSTDNSDTYTNTDTSTHINSPTSTKKKKLHTSHDTEISNKIDDIVKKLIDLLDSLNKLKLNNKLYKIAIKLTFKKIFIPEYYYNLSNYSKFFELLPKINDCYNKCNSLYYEDEERYMKKVYNYYIINELIKYYKNEWNVMNIDEGINIYQQINDYLNKYYSKDNMDENETYINNEFNDGFKSKFSEDETRIEFKNKYGSTEDVEESQFLINNRNENNGLNVLLKTLLRKLINYVESSELGNLYSCHIIMFGWLQFLNDGQIEALVDKYIEELFKKEEGLLTNKELKYQHKDTADKETNSTSSTSKLKIYENIYSNWSKLMSDKSVFLEKVYNKLYNQLNSINYSLYNENKEKLKDLVDSAVEWERLVGSDNMVKLLSSTLMFKFTKLTSERVASLSEMYSDIKNSGSSDNDELMEKKKRLVEEMEDIESGYLYFKSLLPDYVNNSREIQVNHYKVILKSMEAFLNSVDINRTNNGY